MFLEEVFNKLENGEIVYILDEYEEAVFKFMPTIPREVYVRRSRQREHNIDWTSNIAYEARLGGKFITAEEYKKF